MTNHSDHFASDASICAAGKMAFASLPAPVVLPAPSRVDAAARRSMRHAERIARKLTAHTAWAAIVRGVFAAAATSEFAKMVITEWAGVVEFDADGEEFGHYRRMPTAEDVEAYVAETTPARAYVILMNLADAETDQLCWRAE